MSKAAVRVPVIGSVNGGEKPMRADVAELAEEAARHSPEYVLSLVERMQARRLRPQPPRLQRRLPLRLVQ